MAYVLQLFVIMIHTLDVIYRIDDLDTEFRDQ